MRNNLLLDTAKETIVSRLLQLEEDSPRLWGQMNATEMLHHLNASIRLLLTAKPKHPETTLKQRILKWLFLYFFKKFPRNAKTKKDLDVISNGLVTNSFEEEKNDLLRLLNLFQRATEIKAVHPYFGLLTRNEWGIFTWMHIDHHFRQFDI